MDWGSVFCPPSHFTLFKMADEVHVEEGIGGEAVTEKVKRKSITSASGWN